MIRGAAFARLIDRGHFPVREDDLDPQVFIRISGFIARAIEFQSRAAQNRGNGKDLLRVLSSPRGSRL